MRRIFYTASAAFLIAVAYIATPFVAAWSIREAMQNGNSDYLERKIEWDSVRTTLRESLTQVALGTPDPGTVQAEAPPKPGLLEAHQEQPQPQRGEQDRRPLRDARRIAAAFLGTQNLSGRLRERPPRSRPCRGMSGLRTSGRV